MDTAILEQLDLDEKEIHDEIDGLNEKLNHATARLRGHGMVRKHIQQLTETVELYREECNKLRQRIDDGNREITAVRRENSKLEVKIRGLKCSISSLNYAAHGDITISEMQDKIRELNRDAQEDK